MSGEQVEPTADLLALLDPDERVAVTGAGTVELTESLALVANATFVRRVTVLARALPLHTLEGKEGWQNFAGDRYDLRGMALAALDAVILRQGMTDEATADEVLLFLRRLAALAAPDLPDADHRAAARYVVRELLNDREGGAAFVVHYSDYRDGHRRLPLAFHLLTEGVGQHGQVVLRVSVEAINALVGGLDLEVEDAQLAMEAVLRTQIDRGQWGRAEESATKSMLLSVALAEKVRRLLAETERDVTAVDWSDTVPALLATSRGHLAERLEAEDLLMDRMRQARNDAVDVDLHATCVRILTLLGRCYDRHLGLHNQVLRAGRTFLDAQAAQRFRPPPRRRRVDLGTTLLLPALRSTAADAERVGTAFAEAVAGPVPPRLPRLVELYRMLLAPTRTAPDALPDESGPAEAGGVDRDEVSLLPEETEAVREVLGTALAGPARLSELLARATPYGSTVTDLVALSVLWAFAPEHEDGDEPPVEFDEEFESALVVLDDGTRFEYDDYSGSDLLVLPIPEGSVVES